jgi:hypothetical protein
MGIDEMLTCQEKHRSRLLVRCAQDHARGVRFPLDAVYTDPSVYRPGGPA